MTNPLKAFKHKPLDNPQGEEVEGAMSCQEDDCYEVATTGRYLEEVEILTWICKEGHISKIESFHLD